MVKVTSLITLAILALASADSTVRRVDDEDQITPITGPTVNGRVLPPVAESEPSMMYPPMQGYAPPMMAAPEMAQPQMAYIPRDLSQYHSIADEMGRFRFRARGSPFARHMTRVMHRARQPHPMRNPSHPMQHPPSSIPLQTHMSEDGSMPMKPMMGLSDDDLPRDSHHLVMDAPQMPSHVGFHHPGPAAPRFMSLRTGNPAAGYSSPDPYTGSLSFTNPSAAFDYYNYMPSASMPDNDGGLGPLAQSVPTATDNSGYGIRLPDQPSGFGIIGAPQIQPDGKRSYQLPDARMPQGAREGYFAPSPASIPDPAFPNPVPPFAFRSQRPDTQLGQASFNNPSFLETRNAAIENQETNHQLSPVQAPGGAVGSNSALSQVESEMEDAFGNPKTSPEAKNEAMKASLPDVAPPQLERAPWHNTEQEHFLGDASKFRFGHSGNRGFHFKEELSTEDNPFAHNGLGEARDVTASGAVIPVPDPEHQTNLPGSSPAAPAAEAAADADDNVFGKNALPKESDMRFQGMPLAPTVQQRMGRPAVPGMASAPVVQAAPVAPALAQAQPQLQAMQSAPEASAPVAGAAPASPSVPAPSASAPAPAMPAPALQEPPRLADLEVMKLTDMSNEAPGPMTMLETSVDARTQVVSGRPPVMPKANDLVVSVDAAQSSQQSSNEDDSLKMPPVPMRVPHPDNLPMSSI